MLAVRSDDAAAAEAALAAIGHDPTADAGLLDRSSAMDAVLIAYALKLTGKPEQSEQTTVALLQRFEAAPGEFVPSDMRAVRALAYASLGRVDAAIEELEQAVAQGFRTLIDFEYLLRLDADPFMQQVARDTRSLGIVEAIETDIARMRENLIARGP